MKLLAKFELKRFTTVEFLPFGLDWTCVAEIQFSENKDLPNDNDPPRRQKVRNSTVEVSSQAESALVLQPGLHVMSAGRRRDRMCRHGSRT
jgi:hypothetical protein